jgi:hypothetical protein
VTALIVLIVLALTFGLSVGLGVGWIAVLPLLALLAVAVWSGLAFASGRSPAQATRRTRRTELLGPGGPDDPDAGR